MKELEIALEQHRPVVVFMVQAESSTGVKQPLEGFGELIHKYVLKFLYYYYKYYYYYQLNICL